MHKASGFNWQMQWITQELKRGHVRGAAAKALIGQMISAGGSLVRGQGYDLVFISESEMLRWLIRHFIIWAKEAVWSRESVCLSCLSMCGFIKLELKSDWTNGCCIHLCCTSALLCNVWERVNHSSMVVAFKSFTYRHRTLKCLKQFSDNVYTFHMSLHDVGADFFLTCMCTHKQVVYRECSRICVHMSGDNPVVRSGRWTVWGSLGPLLSI